ncbi:hotdog fold domain-containing protein [Intrasporangium sp. YIM S08009]|uniref:hotdog fold domain-containing protein n=1 Tax=Intrasporangium zincisolvens TaxID=3080018 RepID=UPI002B05A487|nr:hotdog fold domain-containing protein [Intrasporangium sp. YIM S08009]
MPDVYALYRRLEPRPFGRWVFARAFTTAAPYFRSVRLRVESVAPNRAVVVVPKRRRVHNHIGTVHAIAACNGLEAAMGLLAEASIPTTHRWIPKGMEVRYVAKSTTDLTCTAETDAAAWRDGRTDVPVRVTATRTDGTVTVEGVIHLHVTPR